VYRKRWRETVVARGVALAEAALSSLTDPAPDSGPCATDDAHRVD